MSDSQASRRPRRTPQGTAARRLPQPSDRPPYRLLADVLRQQILGQLRPGGQVPPTRVLEEDYGIANMTARAAVRVLRDEGLVHTVHGLGTFVTNPLPDAARAATTSADRTHMPTEEYTGLLRRIDQLTEVQDALLRLFGQAARFADQPAA